MLQTCAATALGRIALHLTAAFGDQAWSWHWQGIAREFRRRRPAWTTPPLPRLSRFYGDGGHARRG
jgi:hypothetical protein